MAFKLTYRDGQADDYDDSTKWAVEDGVLKMGRESGKWSVLVSPSHWATIEVADGKDSGKGKAEEEDDDEDRNEARGEDKDADKNKDKGDDENKDDD